jgi:hypothetical protein
MSEKKVVKFLVTGWTDEPFSKPWSSGKGTTFGCLAVGKIDGEAREFTVKSFKKESLDAVQLNTEYSGEYEEWKGNASVIFSRQAQGGGGRPGRKSPEELAADKEAQEKRLAWERQKDASTRASIEYQVCFKEAGELVRAKMTVDPAIGQANAEALVKVMCKMADQLYDHLRAKTGAAS